MNKMDPTRHSRADRIIMLNPAVKPRESLSAYFKCAPAEKDKLSKLNINMVTKPCFNSLRLTSFNLSFSKILAIPQRQKEIKSQATMTKNIILQLFTMFVEKFMNLYYGGGGWGQEIRVGLKPLKDLNFARGYKQMTRKSQEIREKQASWSTPKSSSPMILQLARERASEMQLRPVIASVSQLNDLAVSH